MSSEDKRICKINDLRLTRYVKKNRNGSEQVFYTGNDERDFDRYRAEDGPRNSDITMHDKPDTIRIQPPEKHHYAELIDGHWWWLDGCNECNGRPRNGFTYMGECEKHDVCCSCSKPRSDFKGSVWGRRNGWQCSPCQEAEHNAEKEAALAAMPEEYDEWDFHDKDEITCPYCAYEFSDSWEHSQDDDQKHECPRCDNTFIVTAVPSLTFNCDRLEPSSEG